MNPSAVAISPPSTPFTGKRVLGRRGKIPRIFVFYTCRTIIRLVIPHLSFAVVTLQRAFNFRNWFVSWIIYENIRIKFRALIGFLCLGYICFVISVLVERQNLRVSYFWLSREPSCLHCGLWMRRSRVRSSVAPIWEMNSFPKSNREISLNWFLFGCSLWCS